MQAYGRPCSSHRCGMCVAPRHETAATRPNSFVEHVAPVGEHVDDDAAAVLRAVVPRGALRRDRRRPRRPSTRTRRAREQDPPEEAAVDEAAQLPRFPAATACPARRRAARPRRCASRYSSSASASVAARRLLAVDVLAGGDRAPDRLRAPVGGLRVEVDGIAIGSASAASRSVVHGGSPARAASASSFAALRPTSSGSGMIAVPSASRTPPCSRMATIDRSRCWFVPMRPVTPFMMMPIRGVLTSQS